MASPPTERETQLRVRIDSINAQSIFLGALLGFSTIYLLSNPNKVDVLDTAVSDVATCETCSVCLDVEIDENSCIAANQCGPSECHQVAPSWWTPPFSHVYWDEILTRDYDPKALSNPRVTQVNNVFSKKESKWIIDKANEVLQWTDAQVYQRSVDEEEDEGYVENRRARATGLDRNSDDWGWIYDRLLSVVNINNDESWRELIPRNMSSDLVEHIQIAEYDSDIKGHYNWHQDIGTEGETSRRRLSVVVQLSNPLEYDGGDLQVRTTSTALTLSKEQGQIFIFPSYMLHRVTPTTKGIRYSLALWINTD